jgi:aarF domain-containing kinase
MRLELLSSYAVVAAIGSVIDYKWTFAKSYKSSEESDQATSECHKRSAQRVLKALLANGGEYPRIYARAVMLT